MSNNVLAESCIDEKDLTKILENMSKTGESLAKIILVLLNGIPEDKFVTSPWIRARLSEIRINIDMQDLTPKLTALKNKKGKYYWIEGREIDWESEECIKTLVDTDIPERRLKRPRTKMRLNDAGKEKIKKILKSL
ncbi:MAG: hypothetical protein QGG63_02115 [Candidatus Pacebacteria bacterium]|jgi:hypothetical protein|nr:hypothetical protein [Candidatus Paceibacterota bacterium]|tara:strand:- start:21572 stop:21979 length:408 start_codon:yes stop_codon:yes gene_type:complete